MDEIYQPVSFGGRRHSLEIIQRGLKLSAAKAQLTIRIDRDVLEWYRKKGRGYQTRINRLLRAYMEAHPKEVA